MILELFKRTVPENVFPFPPSLFVKFVFEPTIFSLDMAPEPMFALLFWKIEFETYAFPETIIAPASSKALLFVNCESTTSANPEPITAPPLACALLSEKTESTIVTLPVVFNTPPDSLASLEMNLESSIIAFPLVMWNTPPSPPAELSVKLLDLTVTFDHVEIIPP